MELLSVGSARWQNFHLKLHSLKFRDRVRLLVRRRADQVVLPAELSELGSASQVSHALKALRRDGEPIRLGAGVYAKAHKDAETCTVRPLADFATLAQEGAAKLKMVSAPKSFDMAGAKKSPQGRNDALVLDTGRRRVWRKLSLGGRTVAYVNDRTRKRPDEFRSRAAPDDTVLERGPVRPRSRAQVSGELHQHVLEPMGRDRGPPGGRRARFRSLCRSADRAEAGRQALHRRHGRAAGQLLAGAQAGVFDPFMDFAQAGCLRNRFGEKDPKIVQELEHQFFRASVDDAIAYLSKREVLGYAHFLEVHRILFSAFYPWAGQDRAVTAPDIAVTKARTWFTHPRDARLAVEEGLRIAPNKQ